MSELHWRTTVHGSPEECVAAAARLREIRRRVRSVADVVQRQGDVSGWQGRARAAASMQVVRGLEELADLGRRLGEVEDALSGFGTALGGVTDELARARSMAAATGLPVAGDGFTAPYGHAAASLVREAHAREDAAHRALAAALLGAREGGLARRMATSVLEGVLHLPTGGDALDQASWLVGLPGTADLLGDRARSAMAARAHRMVAVGATSDQALAVGAASAATRVGPALAVASRAAGPVGNVLTVATAGRGQWRADEDDARLSTADRVGRVAVRSGLEGGAVLAGGFVGGQYGATIGTMILPGVGTAVGTAIGAGIGAFAASEAGRAAADTAVEAVDDVIDLAAAGVDAAGDAAEAAGDVAEAVADKICWWD